MGSKKKKKKMFATTQDLSPLLKSLEEKEAEWFFSPGDYGQLSLMYVSIQASFKGDMGWGKGDVLLDNGERKKMKNESCQNAKIQSNKIALPFASC